MVTSSIRVLLLCASISFASPRTGLSVYEKTSGIHVSGFRDGIGSIRGYLKVDETIDIPVEARGVQDITKIKLVSGIVKSSRYGTLTSSGALEGNSLFLPFETEKRTFIAASNKLTYPIKLKQFYCKEIGKPRVVSKRSGGPKSLQLSVEVDSKFRKLHGKNSLLATVLAIKRTADLYFNTFSLNFRINQIRLLDSSIKAKTSLNLLEQFRSSINPSGADYFHLITAQRGYTDAIGLAYLGAGCTAYNVGFTDYASGFPRFVQTLAHEIGHGLNATHDPSDLRSIMTGNGDANTKNPYFSNFSFNEINPYLNDSCFTDSLGFPLPTPSKSSYSIPSEKRKNVSILARISSCNGKPCLVGSLSSKGKPIPGRVIELILLESYKLVRTTRTNKRGEFKFIVSKKGRYFVNDRMSQSTSYVVDL